MSSTQNYLEKRGFKIKIPNNPTGQQLDLSHRRLDWLVENNGQDYPEDLKREMKEAKIWKPLKKKTSNKKTSTTTSSTTINNQDVSDDDYVIIDEYNEGQVQDNEIPESEWDDYQVSDEDYFFPKFQQNSLHGHIQDIELQSSRDEYDLTAYLRNLCNRLECEIDELVKKKRGVKFWVAIKVTYINPKKEDQEFTAYLNTGSIQFTNTFQIEETLKTIKDRLLLRNAHFIREQSGLVIKTIHGARYKVSKYFALIGSGYAPLTKFLATKKAIVNVNNSDQRCFGYAIISALIPSMRHKQNMDSKYNRYFHQYGLDQLQYPVKVEQVPQIEDQLQLNISIFSFFDDEGKGRYPIYVSQKDYPKTLDLLYWDNHYAWIKNFSRFMGDRNKHNGKTFWCKRCLGHFQREQAFQTHKMYCRRIDFSEQIYIMPTEGSKIKFKHYRYQASAPFVIYADFETINIPSNDAAGTKTIRYQKQVPCAVGYKVVSPGNVSQYDYKYYIGADCDKWFIRQMLEVEEELMERITADKVIHMDQNDWRRFNKATTCYLCHKPFDIEKRGDKVYIIILHYYILSSILNT